MSTTVHIDEDPSVTVSESIVDPHPPDSVGFLIEGVIKPSPALLSRFEGSSLTPVRVDVTVDDGRTVAVDLDEEATLSLESVDVGVETIGVAEGVDAIDSALGDGDGSPDEPSGAIAFTVEGTIRDLPAETLADLEGESPTLESVTFSVAEAVETDGGSPLDVLLQVELFGYGVVVRRNGSIEVRSGGGSSGLDLGLG